MPISSLPPTLLTTTDIQRFLMAYQHNPLGLYQLCADLLNRLDTVRRLESSVTVTVNDIQRLFRADPLIGSTLNYPPLPTLVIHDLFTQGSLMGSDDADYLLNTTLDWVATHADAPETVRGSVERLRSTSLDRVKVDDIRTLEAGSGRTGLVMRAYWYAVQTLDAMTYRVARDTGSNTWLSQWTDDDIHHALLFIKVIRWQLYEGETSLEAIRHALTQL